MHKKKEFPNDNATTEWLNSQKRRTKFAYVTYWGYFLEFTGLTGDQIVQSRKADKDYSWEKNVLEFRNWLIQKGLSSNTASSSASAVRGFFAYHRLDLKFRRTEKIQLREVEPKFQDYKFSREDLKRMFDFSDLTEKYVVTVGKSFGLRAGDFIALRRGDLQPYIDRPVPISIGEYTTQKEKVKAYPFIDSDAQPVIKLILERMDREGRLEPDSRILTYSHEIQLSRILQRVADKAGIRYGNKRVRFHCLRKFLCDRLASHTSESRWKQIVGKKISESAYISPENLREDYSRAMADTCFTTQTEGDTATIAKMEALIQIGKSMGLKEEELRGLGGGIRRKTFKVTPEYLKQLEELIEKKRKGDDCEDGDHCGETFEQINESQLLEHLRAGWVIVHRLNNGDLVMKSG
jgi:integrase